MSDGLTLEVHEGVPDDEARYPTADSNGTPIALRPRVIFSSGDRRMLVRTRPVPPNQGGAILVSQATIAKLAGSQVGQLANVEWSPARYRDLLRYSAESRRCLTGAVLAAASALLVLAKEISGSLGQRSSALVILLLAAASATFAKEISDVYRDIRSGR